MRKNIKIPRILKINRVNGLEISVVFNNGESRIIDMAEVLEKSRIPKSAPAAILYRPEALSKVELADNTLSWPNVEQYITLKDGTKERVPFEIGADMLYALSRHEKTGSQKQIGRMIRDVRLARGFTQEELARKSGTTRTYISRIENAHSDLELATLRKIVETGLGKRLEILIK